MTLTFVDSGVLIAAARGQGAVSQAAVDVLMDQHREFASSDFVRLEVLPKPTYFKLTAEVAFYEAYFSMVIHWAVVDELLIREAFQLASADGLSAIDALHIAAAIQVGAGEVVTSERSSKSLHRARGMKIVTIHP
jgi:predicted nucleic acid-binding protein